MERNQEPRQRSGSAGRSRIIHIYARRQVVEGFSFAPDTQWQKELEDSFPYVETDDQKRAITDIKRDMERARPMDRLLCGDGAMGKQRSRYALHSKL